MNRFHRFVLAAVLLTLLGPLFGGIGVAGPLDARTERALVLAMEDEMYAHAFYSAVIDQFGPVRPFANVVRAESRHMVALTSLFEKYEVDLPAGEATEVPEVPATVEDACRMAIEAEIKNAEMYAELLDTVEEKDIVSVFTALATASVDHHLPAFERRVERAGGSEKRMGLRGRGRGGKGEGGDGPGCAETNSKGRGSDKGKACAGGKGSVGCCKRGGS